MFLISVGVCVVQSEPYEATLAVAVKVSAIPCLEMLSM